MPLHVSELVAVPVYFGLIIFMAALQMHGKDVSQGNVQRRLLLGPSTYLPHMHKLLVLLFDSKRPVKEAVSLFPARDMP